MCSSLKICGGDSDKYKHLHSWSDCGDGFIWDVKQMNKMQIVPIGEIVRPVDWVQGTAASGGIDCVWLGNNEVALDTYWIVY
jgi:hypothetical protein